MAEKDSSEEIISLEDLVRDEPKAESSSASASSPTPSSVPAPVNPKSPPSAAILPGEDPSAEDLGPPVDTSNIDQMLEVADPHFAQSLEDIAIAAKEAAGEVEIDSDVESILVRERNEARARGFKKVVILLVKRPARKISIVVGASLRWILSSLSFLFASSKAGGKAALLGAKSGGIAAVGAIKKSLSWFGALPLLSKAMVLAVPLLAAAVVVVGRATIANRFMPKMEAGFLRSFADVADARYTFEEEEGWEDLNNPLFHPEFVVLIERVIVNLKSPGDGSNPMAMADLYIEASSKEAALEISDRESEYRDLIARTIERMTYQELVTAPGKNKLKTFLRKRLNEVITKGRVRRVYYKEIVLKP